MTEILFGTTNPTRKSYVQEILNGLPIDTGLYVDRFPPEKQPGQFVRRIHGDRREATDDDLLAYYIQELTAVGGESPGTWVLGMGLAN
ncbi:MAG TPA: hypothetical protein VNT75_17810 [Symbiobacteriaceae bacterium]|nr:hypothetical protein [Symbiobacteriaceae bacterium]